MRIIPAIDIIGGKCVRLSKGDFSTRRVYNDNPLEVARRFEGHGIKYLHLVDLDGAKSGSMINYRILENICTKTSLKVDFGGGIKTTDDVERAFLCGAEQVTGGTAAAHDPGLFFSWLERFGAARIILGADSRNGRIYARGWTEATSLPTLQYIKDYTSRGVSTVVCTDIERDGMLAGPAFGLYRSIIETTGAKLVASGGISSMNDIVMLRETGCFGAIIGKAIYEGNIKLKELENYVKEENNTLP